MSPKKVQKSKRLTKNDLLKLEQDHLDCRMMRHAWDRYIDDGLRLTGWTNGNRYRRKVFLCGRCKTKRYGVLDRITGELAAGWAYIWPPGYKLSGRAETQVVRKAYLDVWPND